MKTLNDVVNEAYKVFAGNKPGEYLDACTHCCMKQADADALKAMSLRQISSALLKEYQDAAKPVKLVQEELRYFAPRYLELIKDFDYPSYEPLLSLNRFGYFEPTDWTAEESRLFNEFSALFFRQYLHANHHKTFTTAIEILLMFYKAKFDLQPVLDEWEQCTSVEGLLHFNYLMDSIHINKQGIPKVTDAFSDEQFSEIICAWLFSEKIKEKFKTEIEEKLMGTDELLNEEIREALSWKYELLK